MICCNTPIHVPVLLAVEWAWRPRHGLTHLYPEWIPHWERETVLPSKTFGWQWGVSSTFQQGCGKLLLTCSTVALYCSRKSIQGFGIKRPSGNNKSGVDSGGCHEFLCCCPCWVTRQGALGSSFSISLSFRRDTAAPVSTISCIGCICKKINQCKCWPPTALKVNEASASQVEPVFLGGVAVRKRSRRTAAPESAVNERHLLPLKVSQHRQLRGGQCSTIENSSVCVR